ncbi:putative solute:Na(+) symporter [Rhodovastum atsumiense]|uniref:Bile acid:sodium symporter n=1 Tax=Rhodovastum atsumiense TaxID=504468 RepID=A0A5M6IN54_9PROT|nr:bile acid:sodium symporter family protein [Rhodovastum atsumiense]KAA5608978.1 bile acid:sodium symporter [Rhodovastum atsumiense]CAH2603675.1 putative solute:Na(+) symporter [Rhodovastum atsumiense]
MPKLPPLRPMLARVGIDPFLIGLTAMIALAFVLPAQGRGADLASAASGWAIALLFFLHGARLSPQAALAGARHWRLQLVILLSTFALFPLLGLAARALWPGLFPPDLWVGMLLLCLLPSTVQSSIAFTSIAQGNVPAALCAASLSNLVGIVLTPLLTGLVVAGSSIGISTGGAVTIVVQLLLPFLAGQLARPRIGGWVQRHRTLVGLVDRSSILLVVYTAFSEGVVEGIWHQVGAGELLRLLAMSAVLLGLVMAAMTLVGRALGFSREDRVAVLFCGSKKSLASGLPIASVLFAGHATGLIVLPMMLFHQLQLFVCALLARRHAALAAAASVASAP